MHCTNISPSKGVLLSIAFFLLTVSCSKDVDLLASYVVQDAESSLNNYNQYLINDSYNLNGNNSIILDVLNNDTFIDSDKVQIVETSQPKNGTVEINPDNTLTYIVTANNNIEEVNSEESSENETTEENNTDVNEEDTSEFDTNIEESESEENEAPEISTPNESINNQEDTFTYTVETTDEEGEVQTEEGEVTIYFDYNYGELKAFPTAEGFGKYTTGGRGGALIKVVNLNDSGNGSLRAAVESTGKRTIVFEVAGKIVLNTPLRIKNSDVTIAGQTSPGGITLTNNGIEVLTSNVILRYLKVRPGSSSSSDLDAIRVIQYTSNDIMENIVIDHCSLSWGKDEVLSFGVNRAENSSMRNITVQNCIVSEAIDKQYGVLVMGEISNMTFYQNYLAHNKDRQFRASTSGTEFEVINNVIYNFRYGTQLSYGGKFDVINNIYKISNNIEPQSGNAMTYISSSNTPDATANEGKVHQSGNSITNSKYPDTNSTFEKYNSPSRIHSNSLITPLSTDLLEETVLNNVGANIFDDPIDKRVIEDYFNSTGNTIKSESSVGGYPTINSKSRPESFDFDSDGMEDSWEVENGFDPENPNDGNSDKNNDGYTNLEDYLHQLTK
ncbi:Ig-like domain-containing protein [Zobellia barbeyronii]|uniref:RapA2 cadherin-like domain-containing protein n=1 Tax=Zobellia barbeyronii TaxID=2748009 RepID=A0ABS5WJM0_9FLAO|nr:Ig-like domain-containing protein [Zobellia barbeyronii]MBT2163198.1 hypothetical protein [Zobellia barbeyronii]